MDVSVPAGKYLDEEGAGEGAKKSTDRYAAIEAAFSSAWVYFESDEIEDHVDVELSEVGDGISEVEGGQGDVQDDEGDLGLRTVCDSWFGRKELNARTVHWL